MYKKKNKFEIGILLAVLAAALYALSTPFSKLLLDYIPSTLLAGILYIGAGVGMLGVISIRKIFHIRNNEESLSKEDQPYIVWMIVLDILAPIFLLYGLSYSFAENVALLNNFEIVATALIALAVFKESIPKRLWMGIICITVSCMVLSFENVSSFQFSGGSLFVLLAACCWGVENNCTRKLSSKDPLQIVLLKGIFSGAGSLIVGLILGQRFSDAGVIFLALLLGCVAYGLSIYVYVYAQRLIGAARTSAFYAVAPFIGALLSFVIFKDELGWNYLIAFVIMAVGAWLCAKE